MYNQSFIKFKNKGDSQIVEMARKTVVNALKISVGETRKEPFCFTMFLATLPVAGSVRNEKAFVAHLHNSPVRALIRLSTISTVSNALLNKNSFTVLFVDLASNCVERKFSHNKRKATSPTSRKTLMSLCRLTQLKMCWTVRLICQNR